MRLAFLTIEDSQNPLSWSGIPYYIARSLERRGNGIDHLGPMPRWPLKILRARARLESQILSRRTLPGTVRIYSQLCNRVANRRLAEMDARPDVILSPVGSVPLAHLQTDLPVVYLSDATLRLMLDYYPDFSDLAADALEAADRLEQRAITRADLLVYPTQWAADSAIRDYGADPAKIAVIPFGANLTEEPPARADHAPVDDVCRLLFVGVKWSIKGGAIAVETLRALQALGVKAELTVVGCHPPEPLEMPGLTFTGFLDKNLAQDRDRLDELYRTANFFVLPTRNECFGIVFCEAAAYGLPALASRTGGVPEVIAEGRSGFTFPLADGGAAYAARIAEIWADSDGYAALRQSSRAEFETRLNWDVWAERFSQAVESLVQQPHSGLGTRRAASPGSVVTS